MGRDLHFISGLPRSGTTLLGAILRQNPRFHAGMSSALYPIFAAAVAMLSGRNEFHPLITDDMRLAMLRGLFDNYYQGVDSAKRLFDTNRNWSARLAAIAELFPAAKMICCVRPLDEVLESIEHLVRRNPLELSKIFNFELTSNVYGRIEMLRAPGGLVGQAYANLKDAFYGGFGDRLMLLQYSTLVDDPRRALNAVYDFIGEPHFVHDFDDVRFDADDLDRMLGTPGLHRVHGRVARRARPFALPPDIAFGLRNSAFWGAPAPNPCNVLVI